MAGRYNGASRTDSLPCTGRILARQLRTRSAKGTILKIMQMMILYQDLLKTSVVPKICVLPFLKSCQ